MFGWLSQTAHCPIYLNRQRLPDAGQWFVVVVRRSRDNRRTAVRVTRKDVVMVTLANVRFETQFFDLLDRVGGVLHEHSLEVLVGIILLTVFGGVFVLIRLRRRRVPPGVPQAHVPLTGIFGFLTWPRIHGRNEAGPPLRRESEPWDD